MNFFEHFAIFLGICDKREKIVDYINAEKYKICLNYQRKKEDR